jgi:RNA polymerase sigma-70 factor (ECF subfamily)
MPVTLAHTHTRSGSTGSLDLLPDPALMHLAANGSLAAFDALVARHRPALLRVSRALLRDAGLAEDALQDALIGAWRAAPAYRADAGSVRTWMSAIVRNRAIDIRRRGSVHDRLVTGLIAEAERQVVKAAEDIVLGAETRDLVRASLADLPETQRIALERHFFGERTMAEVADEVAAPLGTIKSRIRLGLARLRADDTLGDV